MRRLVWMILFAVQRLVPSRPRLTVLMYHSISESNDFFSVSPKLFRRQLTYIKDRYATGDFETIRAYLSGQPLTRDTVIITFDDGYQDFADAALPVLRSLKMPAMVFVIAGDVDRRELGSDAPLMSEATVSSLDVEIVTVGSHGMTHRKLKSLDADALDSELRESRRKLSAWTGRSVDLIAYPKGSHNERVRKATADAGYAAGFAVIERAVGRGDDLYAIPRIQIDSRDTMYAFRAKLSRAADWYYALWKLFH